ncbi:protein of unknown function [Nocardioides scoriae]|uniref:DUF4397 domain-containing protein n=1 Tax=Nocardioides scoriae TaxID=642780 RepID=A0A1H1LJC5_9ACTN|nr:DUF4397 domain-containing protein [Nocardioides scoriae]SDR74618.1 protein of unknown function [Nocardioides scoriae]
MNHLPQTTVPQGRRTGRRATAVVATVLVATLVTLAGGLVAAASAAPVTADPTTGWIRAGHLSPGTPKADVRLTPFKGGRTQTLSNVAFGELTDYERVPTGLYTVSLVRAGSPMSAAPMISQNVRVSEGAASTVIATGEGEQVRATVLSDDLTAPPAGQAKVRLVSAATDPGTVDAKVVAGPTLAQDVTTGSSTGYADVGAQTWSVQVAGSDGEGSVTRRVPVEAGGVYTLVALNDAQGGLELKAVQDSGSSTAADGAMPTGGVDTGAGGLADSQDGGTGTLATLLAAAVAAGGVLLLRRRVTA